MDRALDAKPGFRRKKKKKDFFSAEVTEGVKASVALEHVVVTTVSGAKSQKLLMPN